MEVMEAIRISYATGKPFYECVNHEFDNNGICACKRDMDKAGLESYQVGKRKAFVRAEQMAELNGCNELLQFIRQKKASILIQCAWRCQVARRELRNLKLEAMDRTCVQVTKNKFEMKIEALTWRLEAQKRMMANIDKAKTQENAKLQSALQEMELQFKETKALLLKEFEITGKAEETIPNKLMSEEEKLKAIVLAQCLWRARVARRELRMLKQEARPATGMQPIKSEIEWQIQELIWKLQFERRKTAELEESKDKENAKLRSALHDMQLRLEETRMLLMQERENARMAEETIQDVLVVDHEA